MSVNMITIDGRIVNDPQIRRTKKKGVSVVNLRLSHLPTRGQTPVYVDVEAWDDVAEKIVEQANRGTIVTVYGELRRDKWQTSEGEERSKLKITASKIMINPVKKNNQVPEEMSF